MIARTRGMLPLIISAAIVAITVSCSNDAENLAARVNGIDITVEELDARVESARLQSAAQGSSITEENIDEFRFQVLENIIENRLLFDYAVKNGYSVEDEVVSSQVTQIKGQFGSAEEYKAALEAQGMSEESLVEEVRKGLAIERMLEAESATETSVSDEDIKEFYDENPDYFKEQESVTASHIIVRAEPDASDEAKQEAREKIEAIRQEIVDGADFAEVAREKSEGPSAPSGGSLGTFTRGQMVAPFEDAAFSLEPGELSEIVLTDFGYHIILVEEKQSGEIQPLDEVSDRIREYLTRLSEQQETGKLVAELIDKAIIEYFD